MYGHEPPSLDLHGRSLIAHGRVCCQRLPHLPQGPVPERALGSDKEEAQVGSLRRALSICLHFAGV